MQKCTRCIRELEEFFFQPPVTICLVCYSRVIQNRDLDIHNKEDVIELRRRAISSPSAKKKHKIQLEATAFFYFAETMGIVAGGITKKKISLAPCDHCGEDKNVFEMKQVDTLAGDEMWCVDCMALSAREIKE